MHAGGTLRGTVRDGAGVGLGNQIVVVFAPDQSVPVVSVTSAADGTYVFAHLTPDVGLDVAVLEQGDRMDVRTLLGAVQARQVMVFEGQAQTLDLRAAGASGHPVAGTLIYTSGQPCVGGEVHLLPEAMGVDGALGAAAGERALVDEAGRFAFDHVGAGTYLLAFGDGGDGGGAGRQRLVVEGPVLGLALTLSSSAAEVVVTDESGSPVAKAQVRLLSQPAGAQPGGAGQVAPTGGRRGIADGAGVARFSGVDDGEVFQVLVRGPRGVDGYGEGVAELVVVGTSTTVYVTLPAGGPIPVRVVDGGTRMPVAGAVLYLDFAGEPMFAARAISDGEGLATLRNVRGGVGVVVVQADGYREAQVDLPRLRGGQPMEVLVVRGAEVVITVLDASGAPVPGARLTITDSEGSALAPRSGAWGGGTSPGSLRTDAQGVMTTYHLAPGSYQVSARRGEEVSTALELVVPTSGRATLGLELPR